MASPDVAVVPASNVVLLEEGITAIIPTLGRESLAQAHKSLQEQTFKPIIVVKSDERDTLIKIKEAVNEAKTKYIAIADDDAIYPDGWIEALSKPFTPKVGFVGGPCLPLIDEDSSSAEKAISEVTSSFFGTTNMSYRNKARGKIKDADETNLVGNGLYRKEVLAKILNEEYGKIPPAAWETYVFTRIKQMGYRTMYNPAGKFYHKQRTNIFSFGRQIFRCGMGRMNFFKQFPGEIASKAYMFLPLLFILYLVAFFGFAAINLAIVTNIPLIIYVMVLMLASYLPKHSSRAQPFYYLMLHFSYGFGMLYGLIRNRRTWQ